MFAAKTNPKASLATHRGRLQAIKQRYTDGSTYEGGYLNFKKQGKGIISFSNGEKYDGHWAEGLKEGSGVYTWADGSQYIGEWHLDRMSGEGVHVSFNGSKYSGSWSGNLMHGSGSYQYDNGSVYKGEWFEGQQQGFGILIVSAKESYEGLWRVGLMHGKGTYIWENGDSYDGDYRDGKKEGSGKLSLVSGEKYDGEWSLGLKHGYGVYTCNDSECYKGEWNTDRMHGVGQYCWPDGSYYKGEWVLDSRSGEGIERLSDGSQYEGCFASNERNGLGSMLYLDGSKYQGHWQHEQWNGRGTFTSADGGELEGVFVNGVIQGLATERDAYGEFLYEGEWKNGVRDGRGLLKTPIGEYTGEFVAGSKHGQGTDTFSSGSKYTGQFVENQRHGHGVILHSNGCIYDGNWKFGECCGLGKYAEPNGYQYNGEWENDLKNGHGTETIDQDTSYEGQFRGGLRHGKGKTTTLKCIQSTSPNSEAKIGQCVHEGMYDQNKKCGVGSELYPDGSCFHGVWLDDLKHGPGLLKIANDATYHVIFHEDTIIDIFYSMEPEYLDVVSASIAQKNPDDEKNTSQLPPSTFQQKMVPAEVISASFKRSGKLLSGRTSSTGSKNTNHVRFDPFEEDSQPNSVSKSFADQKPDNLIKSESIQVLTTGGMFPFSDFAPEDNSGTYDVNETVFHIPEVLSPLYGAELVQMPSQVTVVVDYGIWGAPSSNDALHSVPSRAPRSKSDPVLDFASRAPTNTNLPSDVYQHSRRSHVSRQHARSAKQHRVPGMTSKESVASSASALANRIDLFNL